MPAAIRTKTSRTVSRKQRELQRANKKDVAARRATPTLVQKRRRTYLPAHERRRLIISAAQKVFVRSTLQGARTRELAKAAQVNQATLFEHFASKEDLFHAAVVEPMLEAMKGMRERARTYSQAKSAKDMIDLARSSSRGHLAAMVRIYPLLASALFSDPTLGKRLYMKEIAPMLRERGEVMRGVVKESIDPHLLALVSFGAFFMVAMDRSFRGKRTDLAKVADGITNLLAFGFLRERQR
jgi:AcrR family transcriptional regulator